MKSISDNKSLEILPGEIFVDMLGFEGLYMVSNFGRVRREQRLDACGRLLKSKIMARVYWTKKSGFKEGAKVTWGYDNKMYSSSVSKLVAEAFLGQIPKGFCVVHIDKNVENDFLENLKILTYSESLLLDYKTGHKKDYGFGVVGNVGRNKKVEQLDIAGNIIAEYDSLGDIERAHGFRKSVISNFCHKKYHQDPGAVSYGFRWRFKINEN